MKAGTAQTSIYLTQHDQTLLRELQERHSLTRSSVIRLALERLNASDDVRSKRLVEIAEEIRRLA